MNGAHWHLVLNHLPIIVPFVGLMVMIGALYLKSEILKRAAFSIFIFGALTAIAAFFTGEGAEAVVESLAGIDERFIEVHEETAQLFSIILYLLGVISIIGIWANLKRKSYAQFIVFLALAVTLVGLFYAKETGTSGGEIRHTEIREASLTNTNGNSTIELEENDDD